MKAKEIFMAFKDLEALDQKAYETFNENVYERQIGAKIWDATSILKELYFRTVTGSKQAIHDICDEFKQKDSGFFSDRANEILGASKTHKECKLKLKTLYLEYVESQDV